MVLRCSSIIVCDFLTVANSYVKTGVARLPVGNTAWSHDDCWRDSFSWYDQLCGNFLLYTTENMLLMTTFRCPSDILITSWLFTAWWSTWPGKHLVPCVAELVGSCIPIHARRCFPNPKCLFYPSGLSPCLCVDHFCLVPVNDVVLFHSMVCDGWLSLALEARVSEPAVKESTSFLCFLILIPNFMPVSPT